MWIWSKILHCRSANTWQPLRFVSIAVRECRVVGLREPVVRGYWWVQAQHPYNGGTLHEALQTHWRKTLRHVLGHLRGGKIFWGLSKENLYIFNKAGNVVDASRRHLFDSRALYFNEALYSILKLPELYIRTNSGIHNIIVFFITC
jgi:hypothetical protein